MPPKSRPRRDGDAGIRPRARFRLRITHGEDIALGPGKIFLLEAIRDHGSITEAARQIGMSYRRAWLLLDEVNRMMKKPATMSAHGGQSGGGSVLTPEGEEVIRLYRAIEAQAEEACAENIRQLVKMVR